MTDYKSPLYTAQCRIIGCTNQEYFGFQPPKVFVCSGCMLKKQQEYDEELREEFRGPDSLM